jgi:hypothetical protein
MPTATNPTRIAILVATIYCSDRPTARAPMKFMAVKTTIIPVANMSTQILAEFPGKKVAA